MTATKLKHDKLWLTLDKINKNLEQLNVKLGRLIEVGEGRRLVANGKPQLNVLDIMTLLSLPDHLRKTVMILNKLGRATANQISEVSGRARAVESSYLNQLVVMGHIKKMREGREVVFYVTDDGGNAQ